MDNEIILPEFCDISSGNYIKSAANSFVKGQGILESHHKITLSTSGGSDSDVMLDLIMKTMERTSKKPEDLDIIFFETGVEWGAQKEHLIYLENKYGVKINHIKPKCPVPLATKKKGQPFMSKYVSCMIGRLQEHGFDFANGDAPYEELSKVYTGCQSALKWWCDANGEKSRFSIKQMKLLKEFMILNPPTFKISDKCCDESKKKTAATYEKENHVDLMMTGMRRAEGGRRAITIKSCYMTPESGVDSFLPIYWFTDEEKAKYIQQNHICLSDCYTKYGLHRTGCVGCPFASGFEEELKVVQEYEPKLYIAVNNIFGDSYDYTRKYKEFKNKG